MAERNTSQPDGPPTDAMTQPAQTERPDARVGTQLGKYHIVGRLGQGGMGVVYQAVDTLLQRPVAIKVLPEAVASDEQALQRLLREARAAAKLNHAHVVAIHDINQHDGVHFLVMELVDGPSLASLIEKGPLDWREATRAVADACRALTAAHGAAIIHRDIKPGNLLRAADGLVKLADFGLAKATDHSSLTQSGSVLGTPLFMSPEQCQSLPLDVRSDIYSLGATYYMLLTGQPPYRGHGSIEVMFAHVSNPIPDLRKIRPDLPEACSAIIRKAMAKNPGQRFQSAEQMLGALEAALDGKSFPPVEKDHRPRKGIAAALIGVALLVGLIGWQAFRGGPDSTTSPGSTPAVGASASKTYPKDAKHVLMVLAPVNFHYPDYEPVRRVLEEGGVRVSVASTSRQAIPDAQGGGMEVAVDVLLNEARAEDYDAMVICGGPGVQLYTNPKENPTATSEIRQLIKQMMSQGKLITALCYGPLVLADAGILRGRPATIHRSAQAKVIGAQWVDLPVVESLPFITGRDPEAAPMFADVVLKALRR
jgi:serine/threonine protein kinase/putative intracellular protease/amidase